MSDYKNRDDVITEIKKFKGYLDDDMITRLTIAINRIPSADVVKVVRCKDCEWWDEEEHNCTIRDSYGWDYKPNDYCSYGERKEND